jgi:hypothetical protein
MVGVMYGHGADTIEKIDESKLNGGGVKDGTMMYTKNFILSLSQNTKDK